MTSEENDSKSSRARKIRTGGKKHRRVSARKLASALGATETIHHMLAPLTAEDRALEDLAEAERIANEIYLAAASSEVPLRELRPIAVDVIRKLLEEERRQEDATGTAAGGAAVP